ncbi:MAG: DUF2961 domain-containing protein [Planctomycetes bacterium]|nr:DUF2961 domain-containing protein [Planctomycetota bacterium]
MYLIHLLTIWTALAQVQDPNRLAPWRIERASDLRHLLRQESGARCAQFASTDPAGRGDDHGHFLRLDGHRAVLAEMEGPGTIVRIWSANPKGRLKIYFNGEEQPRVNCMFPDFFQGKVEPFSGEFACHDGGGWISYYPMPYEKSCRVEVDNLENPPELYYHVQYLTYPKDTQMETLAKEPGNILKQWLGINDGVRGAFEPMRMANIEKKHIKIAAGKTESIVDEQGRGLVSEFTIRFGAPIDPAALRALDFRAEIDGTRTMDAPLGDLFTNGFGVREFESSAISWRAGIGHFKFPMPFRKSIKIEIVNHSNAETEIFSDLSFEKFPDGRDSGWALHAEFRSQQYTNNELYEFVSAKGPGKFVGISQSLQGVGDLWYLEGNEEFTIDGEAKPSIVGTGTEDFYNGGWYWDTGPLARPFHGLGVKEEWTTNRTTPYRFFIMDAIPFEKSIVGKIEHGSSNEVRDAYYSSVAFWYAPPSAVREVPAEEFAMPRRWIVRREGDLTLAGAEWRVRNGKVETPGWDAATDGWRAAEYPLFQQFPVSYFKRDAAKFPAEFTKLLGGGAAEFETDFEVPETDLYKLEFRLFGEPGGGSLRIGIDGKANDKAFTRGWFETKESTVGPIMRDGGSILLTKGTHRLHCMLGGGDEAAKEFHCGIDAVVIHPDRKFIKSWWIAPPVACENGWTVEHAPTEEAAFLDAGFAPAKAGWTEKPDAGEMLDLNNLVSPRAPVFGYLFTNLVAEEDVELTMWIGSDDGVRVWQDGAPVFTHAIHRPAAFDQDHFTIKLHKGSNRLLVKVKNDDGGYAFCGRLAPPAGGVRATTRE